MSEPKFTPGPWHFDVDWGAVYSDVIVDNESGKDIICVFEDCDTASDAEIEANARLLAAAPELYEALEMLTDRYAPQWMDDNRLRRIAKDERLPTEGMSGLSMNQAELLLKARATLAKARGETP